MTRSQTVTQVTSSQSRLDLYNRDSHANARACYPTTKVWVPDPAGFRAQTLASQWTRLVVNARRSSFLFFHWARQDSDAYSAASWSLCMGTAPFRDSPLHFCSVTCNSESGCHHCTTTTIKVFNCCSSLSSSSANFRRRNYGGTSSRKHPAQGIDCPRTRSVAFVRGLQERMEGV